jgi:phosphopantetheine adenylyltransferase
MYMYIYVYVYIYSIYIKKRIYIYIFTGDAMKYASIAALTLSPYTKSCEDSINHDREKKMSQPLEPLLAVSLYVEDLLRRLGVDITQQRLDNPLSDFNLSNIAPYSGINKYICIYIYKYINPFNIC